MGEKNNPYGKYVDAAGVVDLERVIKDAQELLVLLLGASHIFVRNNLEGGSGDATEDLMKNVQARIEELGEYVIDDTNNLVGPPLFAGGLILVLHKILEVQKTNPNISDPPVTRTMDC